MKRVLIWIGVIFLLIILWMMSSLISHRWRDLSGCPQEGHVSLTVLTYNTQRMGNFEKVGQNKVIQYLQGVDADILCLQEVEVYKDNQYLTLPELRNALSDYPYTYYDFKIYNSKRQFGNVVFSRYPLINKHTLRYASRGNISSCCDVVAHGDTLRLIVNHLESHHLDGTEQRDTLIDRIESTGKTRLQQAWMVKKAMMRSPYPLIVVGDFNALPIGLTYHCLKLGMRDCFLETSWWKFGCTYKYKWLGARIDYILCSRCLQPYQCRVDEISASDHYPVIASIEWAPGSGNH